MNELMNNTNESLHSVSSYFHAVFSLLQKRSATNNKELAQP